MHQAGSLWKKFCFSFSGIKQKSRLNFFISLFFGAGGWAEIIRYKNDRIACYWPTRTSHRFIDCLRELIEDIRSEFSADSLPIVAFYTVSLRARDGWTVGTCVITRILPALFAEFYPFTRNWFFHGACRMHVHSVYLTCIHTKGRNECFNRKSEAERNRFTRASQFRKHRMILHHCSPEILQKLWSFRSTWERKWMPVRFSGT